MKINGTIFSKPQQDQLKRGIGAELDKVVAKVEDVDARMLNYMGDWASGNEYHENDVVTYSDNLYEVIKAHTSSSTIEPSNTEYYKAMTASAAINVKIHTVNNVEDITQLQALTQLISGNTGRIIAIYGVFSSGRRDSLSYVIDTTGSSPYLGLTSAPSVIATNEIQIRQITKSSTTVINRWVSLIAQSGNTVSLTVNGKSGYSSIEVYYL